MNGQYAAAAGEVHGPLGAFQLESDVRIAFLVLNDARYRTMMWLFGIPRDQVNLASLVLLGMGGHTIHNGWRRMMSGPPFPPAENVAVGVAGLREVVQAVAGPGSRDTSMFGTLVAIAAVGGASIPVARRSARAFESGAQRLGVAVRHRYGRKAVAERIRQINLGRERG